MLPQLSSVDLQDEYNETLFVTVVADFFESSLYRDENGSLLQRVYWRDSTPSQYTADNQQFRLFENVVINASRVVDVAADAMYVEGRVLYALATEDRLLQVYIFTLPPAPLTNVTVIALDETRVNQTECDNPNATATLLVDVTCDWQLRDLTSPELSECYVFALECGTLHTYKVDVVNQVLDETNCTHYEYNYTTAQSLQVEVAAFPFTSPTGVLLTHALVATVYTDSFNNTAPAWLLSTHLCQPAYALHNSTLSSTLDYYERSGVASPDAGAMILRTNFNSTTPLGAFRLWIVIPSPYYGNQVEFFDPIDRINTLQSPVLTSVGSGSPVIRHLAASNTDYTQHNVDALFVVGFYNPSHTVLVAGAFRSATMAFVQSATSVLALPYDGRLLSMGTVYELDACKRPQPLVATSLATTGGSDVLQFDFSSLAPTASPTAAPTPAPVVVLSQEPIRDRTDIPLPNSVIGGSVFRGTCANNTWVRPGADQHRDDCEPYASQPSNNLSQPLWFSFETQLEPAVYMIYTDPSSGTCANPGTSSHPAAPLAGSVVSLWCHCFYNAPIYENEIDQCSTEPVDGMREDHGFIGPVCLNADTMYMIRVRADETNQVGEFDVNVEEWSLRRGGDRCQTARPLDHIISGENDESNCNSVVYTNLCAPEAGRDLAIKCPEIESQHTRTTWFSYETRSFGTGPAALSFNIRFNDTRSMSTIGVLPFDPESSLDVNVTLSLWRACETLLEEPLLCQTFSGQLDNETMTFDFPTYDYTEPLDATYTTKILRPHTTFYVAVSTNYKGDFGICAQEIQDSPDAPILPGFPTPAPTPLACNVNANPGNCSNVCAATPCNASESLDAHLFVQRFSRPDFERGQFGPDIADNLVGIDIIARGKVCSCCMQPMIFDTENITGDDCELGTPNHRFGGRGCGSGGAEGDGVNFRNLSLCLIVSEDGDSVDPDSMREAGVILAVEFCTTVVLEYVVFVNARKGTEVTLFDARGENYPHIPMRDLGPNSVLNMTFHTGNMAPPFISKFHVEFGYGGACLVEFAYRIVGLNTLCGCDPNAPMPNVAPKANASASGACCYNGGSLCADYPVRTVCDVVNHGKWFEGRSCSEGNFCPNQHSSAGSFFGWQHDNTPIDRGYELREPSRKVHSYRPPTHNDDDEESSDSPRKVKVHHRGHH